MNRPFSLPSLIIVLILHAGLIVLAVTALPTQLNSPPDQTSIAVQLLPVQEKEMPVQSAPTPPVPVPPPAATPPEQKPAEPKPAPKSKPKAAPKPRAAREPASSNVKAPAPLPPAAPTIPSNEPIQPAPPVAAAAPQAPAVSAPPAKTSVYISAEYAASNAKPVYPAMSKRYGEQGTVVLRVLVNADGTAAQVEINSSSGYPLLDESARAAVQRWRFRPATSNGKPIADWFLIPIPFKLQN